MAFPNVTDIVATTLEKRSGKLADNVTKNNAVLAKLSMKGKIRPFGGGRVIYEELMNAENGNATWVSGYDIFSVGAQDVISAAEFSIKELVVPVSISNLEQLQNAGDEAKIDLLEGRINAAEATMKNIISVGIYSDGTGFGGKILTGLDAAVPVDPTTGTYGGINRATWTFWRSQVEDPGSAYVATTIQGGMNTLWAKCVRGADRPDLIMAGSTVWSIYLASLQALQRFTGTEVGKLGFPSVKYMDADVILDGGIGGAATATDMYFLNTDYIHFRPHKDQNMVPLAGGPRRAVNQKADVTVLAWSGNLTMSGSQFQGRLVNS